MSDRRDSDLSLSRFEEVLTGRDARQIDTRRKAAVAAVLRFDEPNRCPRVLLMRRAERQGDRWSGHVSFPGGREEPHDASLFDTAVRETREEVGLDLETCARYLGPLDAIRAVARGRPLSTSILPHVFVETEPREPVLGDEAVRTFWFPLGPAARGELDDRMPYALGPVRWKLPCWRYDGETVWGLTYQMLSRLIELVRSKTS